MNAPQLREFIQSPKSSGLELDTTERKYEYGFNGHVEIGSGYSAEPIARFIVKTKP